jgi:hypothetical protein
MAGKNRAKAAIAKAFGFARLACSIATLHIAQWAKLFFVANKNKLAKVIRRVRKSFAFIILLQQFIVAELVSKCLFISIQKAVKREKSIFHP